MPSNFRQAIAINVSVQSLGAILSFVLVLGIAHFWGPDRQGQFALIKSWVDFSSLVILMGLPQGFVFALNRENASPHRLAKASAWYASVTLPLGAGGVFAAWSTGYLPTQLGVIGLIAIALAVAGTVYHGLIRSILLTINDGLVFSLFSVLPAIVLFIAVFGVFRESQGNFPLAYLGTAVVSVLAGALIAFKISTRSSQDGSPSAWRTIAHQALHSLIISACASAQSVVLFGTMQLVGGSVAEVGRLSISLLLVSAVNVICSMISPVLYNRWSRTETEQTSFRLNLQIAASSLLYGCALGCAGWVALSLASRLHFIPTKDSDSASLIIALSLPAVLYSRLVIPALLSIGRPGSVSWAAALRVAIIPALVWLLSGQSAESVLAGAFAWTAAEWIGAIAIGTAFLNRQRIATLTSSALDPS